MLYNEKIFKVLSTQILMSITEPSVALREEKTHPFSPTALLFQQVIRNIFRYIESCAVNINTPTT